MVSNIKYYNLTTKFDDESNITNIINEVKNLTIDYEFPFQEELYFFSKTDRVNLLFLNEKKIVKNKINIRKIY